MSLDVAVAVPFKQRGTDQLGEGEFVVALSLDRDWFSPDQAKRLIDVAAGRGLVSRDDGNVVAEFDPAGVTVPEDYEPNQSILREQSAFERILDALVADGHDKQSAVADVNDVQRRLGVSVEAAAALYAKQHGVEVGDAAQKAREKL
ncbi:DUF2240 family protein [Halogeometricum borinquense]|uniref:DUF2240 family protein n=1 Tax=Halogeometricum borinquense TaxID=60847 RepID=A0A6C0UIA1_9EURY|nr:DUF2240 family protein [Halogeometricum borinquense]QIB75294.1 DUF2240 family protein [Halogeometricum borinquense]QIQ75761.1 DUF2240 family protein [Halogeometricum borinquense]